MVQDVSTNFQWVYPSAAGSADECLNASRHFTKPDDKIGIFYSDNAEQLKKARDPNGVETERQRAINVQNECRCPEESPACTRGNSCQS